MERVPRNYIRKIQHTTNWIPTSHRNGKSTFISLALAIWCSVYKYKFYTLIASAIGETASTFISDIKLALDGNTLTERAFGKLYDTKKCINNKEQIELTNKVMIQSISASSILRGKSYGNIRVELLILDDYQKDDEVFTADQREKKWKKYNDHAKYAIQKVNQQLLQLEQFSILNAFIVD